MHKTLFARRRSLNQESPGFSRGECQFIWLLLDDALSDDEIRRKHNKALIDWVFRRAWEFSGERKNPYVRMRRQREWAELTSP